MTSGRPLRIGVVAGEPSGDVLAAGMIAELKRQHPNAVIEGIGGDNMIAAGCDSLFDMETLSVMGLVEVVAHLPAILKVKNALVAHFRKNPPDIFVGVDAPDFNLRVEAELKKLGIKTVHYVSPTIWAWREKRIHKIARATNCVLGLFPFEADVYQKYDVPYRYVGHTLADAIPLHPDKEGARDALSLPEDATVIAVLPGSRNSEIKSLLPVFTETMAEVSRQKPDCTFVIPAANNYRYDDITAYLSENLPDSLASTQVKVVHGNARNAMIASDAILLASGTATLEAMLCKSPMVAAYKLSGLTYKIMQYLYKAPFFTLPNLLAGEKIIPELLQDEVNPQTLSKQLLHYLDSDNQPLIDRFCSLHETLKQNADKQSAAAILDLIDA